jgi:hypothetical protein
VGTLPKGGGTAPNQSKCSPGVGANIPYLIKGTPATGLFLQKISVNPPCGVRMPNLGDPFTPAELACIQTWANALTAN